MLYMIGIGLADEKDITVNGLEAIKQCDRIFIDGYTSILQVPIASLSEYYGKQVEFLTREGVEVQADVMLEAAKDSNAAFLVVGDVFSATTHSDLFLRAKEQEIQVKVIPNASVLTAVGQTGLSLYKFGRTTTLVFPEENFAPESFFDVIVENKKQGLHTLCLLDIKMDKKLFMTVEDAASMLLAIAKKRDDKTIGPLTKAVACARLGSTTQKIVAMDLGDLQTYDLGAPLHSLIIPGDINHVEEEMLALWKQNS